MMRESEIKSVFDKIEPSTALVEKTRASLRSAAGEEQSFQINIRWLMPKLAVAVFACFTLFAVVFVVNRAPAIYDNGIVFDNKASFESVDASQLPTAMSVSERMAEDPASLENAMAENEDESVLQALIVGKILEKEIYVCKDSEESWGLCLYKVAVSEVIDVANTPDFLSGADQVSVVAYSADLNGLADLPEVGEEMKMLLRKTEDGSSVSPYGEKAGISGAWELYGSVNVENGK